ncbi:MAG: protein kinase [Phormidesmis sp. RL_2_1]|nr:protein kinase [Phormidesmis sp. RL_2_1]
MSSLIGKLLQGGKYKLEAVLGRGGFGLTFRAQQIYLDQVVVIKTLHESFWSAPNLGDLQQQFQAEARRLAMCSHPNVVRVSDFFVEDGLPYMVMDYIPGRSLWDIVLPENPLPVAAAIDYVEQIGKALQVVHAKGLLHRDVKPQNIMIHQLTGEAVLIDFGIARELTQNPATTHTSIVTEGYAPIEQYLPKAHRSAATDVYGLAATLYTLLTAQVPVASILRDRTPLTPLRQLRPDIKAEMAQAIAQGMEIELKDRPQSVGRWLGLLTDRSQKTGLFGRKPQSRTQPSHTGVGRHSKGMPPSLSEAPTQVVAPGMANVATTDPIAYKTASGHTIQKPASKAGHKPNQRAGRRAIGRGTGVQPSGQFSVQPALQPSVQPSVQPAVQPSVAAPRQGCGCVSTLAILAVAIAGAVAGGGLWLYQQSAGNVSEPPILETPVFDAPVESPEPVEPPVTEEDIAPATDLDLEDNSDDDTDDELEHSPSPEPSEKPAPTPEEPPLLLEDSGNPAEAQPGDTGEPVPVPGFPPGTAEDDIRERLGEPTQESSRNGFQTSLYTVVPNRVTLAYAYAPESAEVRQSEAAFSPAADRLIMRTTLVGMLDGHSSKKIEAGLDAVRAGERDRFEFERKGFSGTIERNANGYVHIYVQN